MRGKEYLAAIRADGDILVLETMYFADEIRNPKKELEDIPGRTSARGKELKVAEQLIDAMSEKWRPADYHDSYTDRVKELVNAKRKDKEIKVADEAPEPTNVVDLMDALRQSVDASKKRPSKKAVALRKRAARKGTRTKTSNRKPGRGKKAS